MPLVDAGEFREVFLEACTKFQKSDQIEFNEEFFLGLEKDINKELRKIQSLSKEQSIKIANIKAPKAQYMYRKIYYALRDFSDEIGVDMSYGYNTLNALSLYVTGKFWKDEYTIIARKKTHTIEDINITENYINDLAVFPPDNPCFPATPTVPHTNIAGFKRIFIKDESYNPSKNHKDRLAYEIGLNYRQLFPVEPGRLPKNEPFSIITSGCAGIAIQKVLSQCGLPNLKVLIDNKLKGTDIEKALIYEGCDIKHVDLAKSDGIPFTSERILELTNNKNGFDLTFGEGLEDIKRNYYSYLAYEILNVNPTHIFLPFGSGDLTRGILQVIEDEAKNLSSVSKKLFINPLRFKSLQIYAATTTNPLSKMDKLYSPVFQSNSNRKECERIMDSGIIDVKSSIHILEEKYALEAFKIAKEKGIETEHSGIAGLGLLLKLKDTIKFNVTDKILVVNTGKLDLDYYKDLI